MPIWTFPQEGEEAGADFQPQLPSMIAEGLSPAVIETEGSVLRVDPRLWLIRDEGHAGVCVSARLRATLCKCNNRVDAELRHLERVLVGSRGDFAIFYRLNTGAATIDRHDRDVFL